MALQEANDVSRGVFRALLKKGLRCYTFCAVNFCTTLILFVLLNLVLWVVFRIKDGNASGGAVAHTAQPSSGLEIYNTYGEALTAKAYPGWSKEDLDQLLQETQWATQNIVPNATRAEMWKESAQTGKFVNVDKNGYRRTKGQGPWPPDPRNLNLFLFGGSTAHGMGVTDDETIASALQGFLEGRLSKPVKVYNFGRRGYYSASERMLLEDLLLADIVPDVVLFLDGINEFVTELWDQGASDPAQAPGADREPASLTTLLLKLPATRAARSVRNRVRSTAQAPSDMQDKRAQDLNRLAQTGDEIDRQRVERYVRNKRLTEALCRGCNITPLFVWQPCPFYKYDHQYHLFFAEPYNQTRHKYAVAYSVLAKRTQENPSEYATTFLWLADVQEGIREPLYVDLWHYSAKFSEQIAVAIAQELWKRNLLVAGPR